MSLSFSFLRVYIIFLNLLLVFSQSQQQQPQLQQSLNTGNVVQHQQQQSIEPQRTPQKQQVQQQQSLANNNNNNPNTNSNNEFEQGVKGQENQVNNQQQQAVPIVGLFSSSYRGLPVPATSAQKTGVQKQGQFVATQQSFSTYPGFNQDVQFTTTGVQSGIGQPQQYGLYSNGDFELKAYFGQTFWIISGVVLLIIILFLVRSWGGFALLGNMFENFRESEPLTKNGKTGRAIDLDKLSTMVYKALDQYGKWKNSPGQKASYQN